MTNTYFSTYLLIILGALIGLNIFPHYTREQMSEQMSSGRDPDINSDLPVTNNDDDGAVCEHVAWHKGRLKRLEIWVHICSCGH